MMASGFTNEPSEILSIFGMGVTLRPRLRPLPLHHPAASRPVLLPSPPVLRGLAPGPAFPPHGPRSLPAVRPNPSTSLGNLRGFMHFPGIENRLAIRAVLRVTQVTG